MRKFSNFKSKTLKIFKKNLERNLRKILTKTKSIPKSLTQIFQKLS